MAADKMNKLKRDVEEIIQEKEPSFWEYFSIPRLIFFAIVVFYLLFGATVLHVLERGNDDDGETEAVAKDETKPASSPKVDTKVDLTKVVEQLWDDSQNEDISEEDWKKRTKATIEKIDADDDDDDKGKGKDKDDKDDDDDDNISWTFAQSFLYTTASLTRIGSTVQPETFFGRLFVLFYTFFGIPLLLIFFADLGKIFVNLLQTVVEQAQKKLKMNLLPSILNSSGELNAIAFVLAVGVVLGAYVTVMALFFRLWCGGSIFGNIYTAFLIVFGVGPSPIGGTESCTNAGVLSILPALIMIITAPIAWSLTNMQTDIMGTEYIIKIHTLLRKLKRE